jgi:hypothetical protein
MFEYGEVLDAKLANRGSDEAPIVLLGLSHDNAFIYT